MENEKMPADWAIERAFEEAGDTPDLPWIKDRGHAVFYGKAIFKLARYIEAHEQPPVDRKLLCAREAAFQAYYAAENFTLADAANDGMADSDPAVVACVSAITLWEEGFGK